MLATCAVTKRFVAWHSNNRYSPTSVLASYVPCSIRKFCVMLPTVVVDPAIPCCTMQGTTQTHNRTRRPMRTPRSTRMAGENQLVCKAIDELSTSEVSGSIDEILGSFRFSQEQLQVFEDLAYVMRQCCWLWALLTLSDALFTTTSIAHVTGHVKRVGVEYSNLASLFNDGVTTFLVFNASHSFKEVIRTQGNQMPPLMQGILGLSNLFVQLGLFTASVAVLQLMEAAIAYPNIRFVMFGFFAGAALLRSLALAYLHGKYRDNYWKGTAALWGAVNTEDKGPLERGAIKLVGMFLMAGGWRKHKKRVTSSVAIPGFEYEFNYWDERIMGTVVDALRTCGLCYFLQSFSTVVLAISKLGLMNYPKAILTSVSTSTSLAMGSMAFAAAFAFNRIIITEGSDVANLLKGLGWQEGMAALFVRLGKVALTLNVVQTGTTLVAVAKAAGTGVSVSTGLAGAGVIVSAGVLFLGILQRQKAAKEAKLTLA